MTMPQSCVLNVNKKAAHTLIILIHNQSHVDLPTPAARSPSPTRRAVPHDAPRCTDLHGPRTAHVTRGGSRGLTEAGAAPEGGGRDQSYGAFTRRYRVASSDPDLPSVLRTVVDGWRRWGERIEGINGGRGCRRAKQSRARPGDRRSNSQSHR